MPKICAVDECDRASRSAGYCVMHYTRYRRHGDPLVNVQTIPFALRFWSKVKPATYEECWAWTGSLSSDGYGTFGSGGRRGDTLRAHRVAYVEMFGDILGELHLDHLCRNRACVNPWHLDPVTNAVNAARGAHKAKTHCKWGHEYTPSNTYVGKRGNRFCRECKRIRGRKVEHA